jgi:hypothetical protein
MLLTILCDCEIRETLSASKRTTQNYDMQRSGFKKLNDTDMKEHFQP